MLPTETHAVEKKTRPPTFDYSLNPYMKKRWDALGRKLAFSAKDQTSWRSWRRALARKLKQLTGYDTMIRTPPRPRITGQKDLGDLIRQHVVIRTEPGVLMPMYVLMPKSSPGLPACRSARKRRARRVRGGTPLERGSRNPVDEAIPDERLTPPGGPCAIAVAAALCPKGRFESFLSRTCRVTYAAEAR